MDISLQGKTAVITGAFSGIGLAVALRFLESGAAGVVAVDRQPDVPDALTEARAHFGDKLLFVHGDVALESTAEAYTQAALDHFGKADILVSNAARSIVKPLHLHTPEEWDAVMDSNVKALYWAARHLLPSMLERNTGLILISGSISGVAGIPTQGAYAPSKGALHQMARQMAIEYAPQGIRVNSIACGTVDTPIVHQSAEASGDAEGYWTMLKKAHPLGRIATAAEIADFFTYMASDRASFFTGAVILMDGGYTAQ